LKTPTLNTLVQSDETFALIAVLHLTLSSTSSTMRLVATTQLRPHPLPAISSRQATTTETVTAAAVAADVATKAEKDEGVASKAPLLSQRLQLPLQLHRTIHNPRSAHLDSLYLTAHIATESTPAAQPGAGKPIPTSSRLTSRRSGMPTSPTVRSPLIPMPRQS
jgi:hypothetical protein